MRSLDVPHSPWLTQLLAEVDDWADVLRAAAPTDDVVVAARDDAAVATLRLDGSPITAVPPRVEDLPVGTVTGPARGGWLEVLRAGAADLETAPDEVLLAVEHHGARAGLDADDLVAAFRSDPAASLADLHARVTDGLLAPDVVGRLRQTDQAVHDASVGRVLFFPVDPSVVGPRLDAALTWVADADAHPVVVSGVLHHQLLDIHPYEAANGRLARIAARLVLAEGGIDPARVAQPEAALAGNAIGYLDDVARSRRLGDPAAFVARWAEAVAAGLRFAARDAQVAPEVDVPHATVAFLVDHAGQDVTVLDHRRAGGEDAGLDAALRAGLVERLLGTRGLRWRVPAPGTRHDDGRMGHGTVS